MTGKSTYNPIKQNKVWKNLFLHPRFFAYLICSLLLLDSLIALLLHPVNFGTTSFMTITQIAYPVAGLVFFLLLYAERLEKLITYIALFLLLLYPYLIIEAGFLDARMSVHYVPIGFIIQLGKNNRKLSFEAFLGFIAILLFFFLFIVLHPEIDLDSTSKALQIQLIYSMSLSALTILIDYLWQKARSYYLTIEKALTDQIGQVTATFAQLDANKDSLKSIIQSCETEIDTFFSDCETKIQLTNTIQQEKNNQNVINHSIFERAKNSKKSFLLDQKEILIWNGKHASALIVPIIGKKEFLGCIQISNDIDYYFNESHIRLAEIISSLIASKILEFENKSLIYQSLEVELESQKLQELDELKSHFVHNISRDIQTPLQLIMGPSVKLMEKKSGGPQEKMAGLIHSNANQLKDILNQLLQLSELDVTSNQLNIEQLKIGKLFQLWSENFIHSASEKHIDFKLDGQPDLDIPGDRQKLTSIIHNLVNNALKYTPEKGTVEVYYGVENNRFFLDVHDSGEGIPEVYREKVFDRFFRLGEADGKGTGIGLSIVQELTEIMGGSVHISGSHLGGTLFSFSYSLQYVSGSHPPNSKNKTEPIPVANEDKKPLLLIVEDHPDMRTFISACLSDDFNCVEAENGSEGLAIAEKVIPDLIVTDLMMPKMTGEELCAEVRKNEKTRHIPIVVLSAKSGQLDKVNLYEIGADNYLTKPFESEELLAIVAVLIQSRNLTREKFRQNFSQTAHLDAVFEHEETSFMEKVIQSIENHMDDGDFTILTLCNELNMGRNQLQRKMKALTDLTPVEFVRFIRLKKAALQLAETNLSVSEVAYKCGFNNLSYFTKVFKAMFKCLPSQYSSERTE